MELPLGGPALRHYTQSRPRPHRQKLNYRPTRPQETIIECENEDFELMGRVDEGVEEFFTKKVLPTETLKKDDDEDEEIIETITVHEVSPASAAPCPPPAKTLRRKLGDFFTLKKRRGLKSETCHEGRPKKASIADFIRPLREVARGEKDKEKVREHDKENEKEKGKDAADTGEAIQGISISDAPPMRGEAVPPRRALREGKSQSLILLSGSSSGNTRHKKQLDGQNSFEQKLHLMLQRIGVSKPQSEETKNQEGEMKKAESEGTIIDSKPEPPSSKPRTMSASSDTRHQLRSSVSAHESAGKPPLLPKPVLKPAPSATTFGRNAPENELGQIVEKEPSALTTTQSPEAVSVSSTPATATISDTAPATVVPSSTVIPTDKDICTDSVDSSVETTALTKDTEPDSTATMPEASTTTTNEQPDPTIEIEKALTSTTTPASPEPDFLNLIVTSSPIITTPSIITSETVQSNDISTTTTTAADLSTKITFSEPNGATEDSESSKTTSISNVPADLSESLVTTAGYELTSSALPSSESQVSTLVPDVKTKSEAPNLSDTLITVTSMISSDTTNVTSSSTITTSCAEFTTTSSETPPSTTSTVSPSTLSPTHTSTVTQDTTHVTSITSNTAQMADTLQNTTVSTASPLLPANSDLHVGTALTPVIADVSAEDSDETSDPLTTNKPDEHSDQDRELQASPPEAAMVDINVKSTAEEVPEIQSELIKTNESKTPSEAEKVCENKIEETSVISSKVIVNDDKEDAKPKEEQIKTNETAVTETGAIGTLDELSEDYVMIVDQKQQESTGSDEK